MMVGGSAGTSEGVMSSSGLNVSFDACICAMFRALVKSSLAPAICLLAKITGLGSHFDLHGHALLCSNPLTPAPWPLSAVVIWWMALQTWLLIAVTLERFSLAEGTALASTCMPTVRRQPYMTNCDGCATV